MKYTLKQFRLYNKFDNSVDLSPSVDSFSIQEDILSKELKLSCVMTSTFSLIDFNSISGGEIVRLEVSIDEMVGDLSTYTQEFVVSNTSEVVSEISEGGKSRVYATTFECINPESFINHIVKYSRSFNGDVISNYIRTKIYPELMNEISTYGFDNSLIPVIDDTFTIDDTMDIVKWVSSLKDGFVDIMNDFEKMSLNKDSFPDYKYFRSLRKAGFLSLSSLLNTEPYGSYQEVPTAQLSLLDDIQSKNAILSYSQPLTMNVERVINQGILSNKETQVNMYQRTIIDNVVDYSEDYIPLTSNIDKFSENHKLKTVLSERPSLVTYSKNTNDTKLTDYDEEYSRYWTDNRVFRNMLFGYLYSSTLHIRVHGDFDLGIGTLIETKFLEIEELVGGKKHLLDGKWIVTAATHEFFNTQGNTDRNYETSVRLSRDAMH